MPHVSVGTTEVSYGVTGSGPGLVLVHGTGSSAAGTWGHLLRHFTEEWTVVTPDLPGSGRHRGCGGPAAARRPVSPGGRSGGCRRARSLRGRGLLPWGRGGRGAGGGQSRPRAGAGAGGGYRFRHRNTERAAVRALARPAPERSGAVRAAVDAHRVQRDLPGRDPLAVDIGRAATFPIAAGLERHCDLNTRIDLTGVAPAIRAPTLVLGCTHDWIVPIDRARALAALIDGATFDELESGHLAVLEGPGRARRTCARLPARPGGMNHGSPTFKVASRDLLLGAWRHARLRGGPPPPPWSRRCLCSGMNSRWPTTRH